MRAVLIWGAFFAAALAVRPAIAQTSLTGSALVLKSSGSTTLSGPDYLGTYLTVPAGGATIRFTLNATEGTGTVGDAPVHMNIVVADAKLGLSIGSTSATNYTTGDVTLPAGTYVVRAERDYAAPGAASPRSVTVNNLSVSTVTGTAAAFSNSNTNTNALNAANTYISNFRQGPAQVTLNGADAGAHVTVNMVRSAFNFGVEVSGTARSTSPSSNSFLYSGNTNPNAVPYRQHLLENFNTIVPGNAGKWDYQEGGATQPSSPSLNYLNDILNYAQANQLRMRMHTLLWNSQTQQPDWVDALVNSSNTAALSTAIANRIKYYVGDATDGNPNDDLAKKYFALDVLNEQEHQKAYLNLYGASGIANIYNQVANAAASVGANVRLYTNEYNVLLDGADTYGNWYRDSVESIRNAGGNVGGVGVQYYVRTAGHSPSKIMQTLQNLSVDGLPITLTEFGVQGGNAAIPIAPGIMEDTLRLVYGNANSDGFLMWGFWQNGIYDQAFASAMYYDGVLDPDPDGTGPLVPTPDPTGNWTLTPTGERWQSLMDQWTTPTMDLVVGPGGVIDFTGFYGDYDLVINGRHYSLSLDKGTTAYAIAVPEPGCLALFAVAAATVAAGRQFRRIKLRRQREMERGLHA